ncbi:MAG TPA: hypothetical protein ENL20_10855 [Candidatus Cloacimonetes bacterium]|nr:hypothetical protein [Candidatus Cloacimonadota bacterium]
MNKHAFFQKQNSILKIIVVLFGLLISTTVQIKLFLLIFFLTLVYLIISPAVIFVWLKTILKLLPFLFSFFLLGIIFNIPFDEQILVVLRILFILLLSVFLASTNSIESILACFPMRKANSNFFFFLVATISFVPIFIKYYQIEKKKDKNILRIIENAFFSSFRKINEVEISSKERINTPIPKQDFWNIPNFSLLLLIAGYVILLSI